MKNFWVALILCLGLAIMSRIAQADLYEGAEYSPERRVYSVAWYLLKYANKDQQIAPRQYISQEEIEKFAYFLHYYQYSLQELELARTDLVDGAKQQKIPLEKLADSIRILEWFIDLKVQMNEYEKKSNGTLRCKFSYGDRLKKNIEDARYKEMQQKEVVKADTAEITALWDTILTENDAPKAQAHTINREAFANCWDTDKYRD